MPLLWGHVVTRRSPSACPTYVSEEEEVGHHAMSDEKHSEIPAMGLGVDYKTLFLGACTIVVLLAGAAFRIWDSGNNRDREDLTRRLDKLETRIAEVEAGHQGYHFEIEHLKRALERR